MKKILYIGIGENFGGIEKLELEYVKHINKNKKIQIDVLTPNKTNFLNFEKELNKYDSNLFNLNITKMTRKDEVLYDYRLYKFLKSHKYDIIHINSEIFFYSFRIILIAKLCGIKTIFMHCHGIARVNPIKKALIKILNPWYRSMIDEYLTCSKAAEESLYTKSFIKKNEVITLKNGIDINDYKYDDRARDEYKEKFKLNGKVVYGHIGRFKDVKNHNKLIDIFYELQKIQKDSVLLLIGDGELKQKIQDKVNQLKLNDKVIFLGFREDANKILNAIDILIFPSLSEGLGLVLIEAQTNGIKIFCSDTIPTEAKISENFHYFRLEDDCYQIAKRICEQDNHIDKRKQAYKNTISNGYDIKDVSKQLEKMYLKYIG